MPSQFEKTYVYAAAAVVLGFVSVIAWALPVPMGPHLLASGVGTWLGLRAVRSPYRGMAWTGLSMCAVIFLLDVAGLVALMLFS